MAKGVDTLAGKCFLVTGATDGIGKHTATRLAQDGACVLLHGRSLEKATATAEAMKKQTGNPNIEPFGADLSCMKQVRRLAGNIKQRHPSVSVLLNNAGVFPERLQKTEDGYELTWAVNVMAPFLLTGLLLDTVTERVVNVSSISAGSHVDFDNLQQEKGFSSHNAYSLSKLAMMLFTVELASRLGNRGVSANCLDPGTVNTKMLYAGWGPCGMSVQDANDEYKLATGEQYGSTSGKYYVGARERSMPREAHDAAIRARLWQTLEEQTGFTYPSSL